jgi:UDP-2-acetamido-3-amino-2,3-dideoxy-glucuronate N-acetyltransferase
MTIMNKIGIIGIGNWGKNLVRDFSKISDIKKCTSKGNIQNIKWLKKNYPSIEYVPNYKEIFNDNEINAVIISTPIKTHYSLVKKALLSKKHVFIEKPLCSKVSEAQELIKIAKKNNVFLFVGHIFLFNEVLKKLIEILKKEKITYIEFQWNKFGTFDEDIFLNLLSHDISIILKLFGKPKKINVQSSFGFVSKCDIVTLNVKLSQNLECQIYLNRYSDKKQKTVKIFTDKNVYIWNDLKLYKNNKKSSTFKLIYESKLTPLEIQCKNFIVELNKSNNSFEYANLAKDVIQVIEQLRL